jgi:hypothetical protein
MTSKESARQSNVFQSHLSSLTVFSLSLSLSLLVILNVHKEEHLDDDRLGCLVTALTLMAPLTNLNYFPDEGGKAVDVNRRVCLCSLKQVKKQKNLFDFEIETSN